MKKMTRKITKGVRKRVMRTRQVLREGAWEGRAAYRRYERLVAAAKGGAAEVVEVDGEDGWVSDSGHSDEGDFTEEEYEAVEEVEEEEEGGDGDDEIDEDEDEGAGGAGAMAAVMIIRIALFFSCSSSPLLTINNGINSLRMVLLPPAIDDSVFA